MHIPASFLLHSLDELYQLKQKKEVKGDELLHVQEKLASKHDPSSEVQIAGKQQREIDKDEIRTENQTSKKMSMDKMKTNFK